MVSPMVRVVVLPDLAATEALAERLAGVARAGDCMLLEGPLGAGKTALARAFLRAAADDPRMEVPSPSFTLVQIYDTMIGPVFHYDLWRLDGPDSLTNWTGRMPGMASCWWNGQTGWGPLRPDDALTITLRLGEGALREATLAGWDERLRDINLAALSSPGATR